MERFIKTPKNPSQSLDPLPRTRVPSFKTQTRYARVRSEVSGKSKVQQNAKDECDINKIVKKANAQGFLPPSQKEALYADVSESGSYHEAMNVVLHAQEQFDALPSHVRKRFQNDPAEFLEFAHNPDNVDEMVSLGLAKKRETIKTNANDSAILDNPNVDSQDLATGSDKTPQKKAKS